MSFQWLLGDWQGSSILDGGGRIIPPARNGLRTCTQVQMCVLGNEKRPWIGRSSHAQSYITRLFAKFSWYFRPRWKCRHTNRSGKIVSWGKKSSWDKLFPGNFGGNAAFVCTSKLNMYYAQENAESYAEASSIQSSFSEIHHFSPERKKVR